MDQRILTGICSQIYQRFPDLRGVKPKVQEYEGKHVLLIFKGSSATADGRSLARTVRAVVTPEGKITKVTTSR